MLRYWCVITFPGTNWSPAAAKLAADGAHDFPWLEGAYLSQKLGSGAVVETADGFVLTLCRSKGVAEGQGVMDAPGGHPEPKVSEQYENLCGLVFVSSWALKLYMKMIPPEGKQGRLSQVSVL